MTQNNMNNIDSMLYTVIANNTRVLGSYDYKINTMEINSTRVHTLGTLLGTVCHEYGHAVHNALGYRVGNRSITDENMANYIAREIMTELFISHRIDTDTYTRALALVSKIATKHYNTDETYAQVSYMYDVVSACKNGLIDSTMIDHVYDVYAAYNKALNIGEISKESNREIQIQGLNMETNNTARKNNSKSFMMDDDIELIGGPITLTSRLTDAILGKSVATVNHKNPETGEDQIFTVVKLADDKYAYMVARRLCNREWGINIGAVNCLAGVEMCEDLLSEFSESEEIDNAPFIANLGLSGLRTFSKLVKAYTKMLVEKKDAAVIYCTGADERRQKAYRYLAKFDYVEEVHEGIKTWVYYA